jgi:hypothetical protein
MATTVAIFVISELQALPNAFESKLGSELIWTARRQLLSLREFVIRP